MTIEGILAEMSAALAIAVLAVALVIAAYLMWRRRQRRKLEERRALASQHREMATMSHFEAEREAARAGDWAARARKKQLEQGGEELDPDKDHDGQDRNGTV